MDGYLGLKDIQDVAKVMYDPEFSALVDAYLAEKDGSFGQPQFTIHSLPGQGTSTKPHESKGIGHLGYYRSIT